MLCPRNAHRMYLAGVLLAAKLMDDNVFNNPYWAKVVLSGEQEAVGSLWAELNALHAWESKASAVYDTACRGQAWPAIIMRLVLVCWVTASLSRLIRGFCADWGSDCGRAARAGALCAATAGVQAVHLTG